MTEAEWLACAGPEPMLMFIEEKTSGRKLRLLGCACCRRVENLMHFPEFGRMVEVAEQYADGRVRAAELLGAKRNAETAFQESRAPGLHYYPSEAAAIELSETWPADGVQRIESVQRVMNDARRARSRDPAYLHLPSRPEPLFTSWPIKTSEILEYCRAMEVYYAANEAERSRLNSLEGSAQAPLIRDIFGNPFRPVAFSPAWRTDTALSIARGMYDSRDFSAMPILADALQDAGCDNDDILDHCHRPGPHVRGCWVVDLVLGKS